MNRAEAVALLSDVAKVLDGARPREVMEVATSDGYVWWLWNRAHAAFRAGALLVANGFDDEAIELGRSLFTDALRLLEIERLGDDRHAVVLGWANDSITERQRLFEEAVRLGLEHDAARVMEVLRVEREKLLRYQARHGIPELRRFPAEKVLARRFGLTKEYWDYRYAHQIVHGMPVVMTRLIRQGDVTGFTQAQDATYAGPAAMFLSQFALHALRGFLGMLQVDKPPEIAAHLDRIDEAARPPP